jgi:SAM-dependent methyltransferase
MQRTLVTVPFSVGTRSARAEEPVSVRAVTMSDRATRFAKSLEVPSRILDAGCGPGRDLAVFVACGHLAVGVDPDPAVATRAARYASTYVADLHRLSELFPRGSFDGIWASRSLVGLPEDDAIDVLWQFFTLLRAGGRLYASIDTFGIKSDFDDPERRHGHDVWGPTVFERAVAGCGFALVHVDHGPCVEVWAIRLP